jgi:uncharacterized protein (TIGR03790 family)
MRPRWIPNSRGCRWSIRIFRSPDHCPTGRTAATNTALLNPTNGILLVARLDGPNAKIAKGLVDKALAAERDGLWGRALILTCADWVKQTVYYLGDQWIAAGAEICRDLGFETTVDDKPETFSMDFPMSQIAIYCGWYDVKCFRSVHPAQG